MSDHNRKFFDIFTLVMGGLVAVGFFLVIFARWMGGDQADWLREDPAYVAAVDARLAPAGRVALPGDAPDEPAAPPPAAAPAGDAASVATRAAAAPPVAASVSAAGESIYQQACLACHGTGVAGAPRVGDAAAWKPRLAQGRETLDKHGIEGYQGAAGYMPPKGGRPDLSDADVAAAVDYMLDASGS